MITADKQQAKIYSISALLLLALILIGWMGIETVENQLKENLREQLKANLNSTLKAFDFWAKDKKIDAEIIAQEPSINKHLQELIEFGSAPNRTQKELLNSESLKWLREELGKFCDRYGFVGFVVFNKEGRQVGALLDAAVGKKDLRNKSQYFSRSIRGETALILPFESDIPLQDSKGTTHSSWPTMFISTPVYSEDGKIRGVLGLRLRPETVLSNIMKVGRFGKSGESYMLDQNARLLTQSRFDQQLIENRMLKSGETSILNISIRNPGRNILRSPFTKEQDSTYWPLTTMAQSALDQNTAENVEGYPDYRGVPVVGAWTWIPEYNFAITSEIDRDEAYGPIQTLTQWFTGLVVLMLTASIIGFSINLRHRQARRTAIENEKRLHTIVNSLQDPIIAIDHKGTIITASPSVQNRFLYRPDELIGKNVKMLMPEPYKSEHDQYLENYLKTGNAKIINLVRILEGKRKDGTTFPLELRVTETFSEFDKQPQFTGIIRDITDLKISESKLIEANQLLEKRIDQRTRELKRATTKAERNSAAKTEFLSRMSHELRTPMNAILGFSQLLCSNTTEPLTSNQNTQVNEIIVAGRHLLELINEVLDLASIESGKISFSSEPVCMVNLMHEIISVVEPLASQYQVSLINEVDQHQSLYVRADKVRLKQVLLNLISNGIKYNRIEGSVTVSANIEDKDFLRIDVKDTGRGIPKEKLKHIFDPFDRLGAEFSETEGTGIGMTISKKLMELMEGSIDVESKVGKGSCFYITIPRCDTPKELPKLQEVVEYESEPTDTDASKHKLLYIEDNPANMRLVGQILKNRPGIEFLSATQATEGLELARKHRPSIIILDINLPGMDGYTALKHLQNYDETYQIPVIALSANAMKKDISKGLEAGFKDYLTKPIDMINFLNVIDMHLPAPKPPGGETA